MLHLPQVVQRRGADAHHRGARSRAARTERGVPSERAPRGTGRARVEVRRAPRWGARARRAAMVRARPRRRELRRARRRRRGKWRAAPQTPARPARRGRAGGAATSSTHAGVQTVGNPFPLYLKRIDVATWYPPSRGRSLLRLLPAPRRLGSRGLPPGRSRASPPMSPSPRASSRSARRPPRVARPRGPRPTPSPSRAPRARPPPPGPRRAPAREHHALVPHVPDHGVVLVLLVIHHRREERHEREQRAEGERRAPLALGGGRGRSRRRAGIALAPARSNLRAPPRRASGAHWVRGTGGEGRSGVVPRERARRRTRRGARALR